MNSLGYSIAYPGSFHSHMPLSVSTVLPHPTVALSLSLHMCFSKVFLTRV